MENEYDVVIIGAGVVGTSALYMLSKYSNVGRILLLEKYGAPAPLNSDSHNNSQTLHFGDIETNYPVKKAQKTSTAAHMLLDYVAGLKPTLRRKLVQGCEKMALAVGEEEIKALETRYYSGIRSLFPKLKLIDKNEIAIYEPNVVKGRDPDENIKAIRSPEGYMVNFGGLARSFINLSKRDAVKIRFNTEVKKIKRKGGSYILYTAHGEISARMVIFAAGAYSLMFAKSMGYAGEMSILSVGGGFYHSPKVLNGKVYRIQMGDIPFAAIHGDPDINYPSRSRFGPTVDIYPFLEKGKLGSFIPYMKSFDFDIGTFESLFHLLFHRDIQRILSKNLLYKFPIIGRDEFAEKEVRKIVPLLKASDLTRDTQAGGIRPQIIDEKKKRLIMGEARVEGSNILFNITPSPGASSCLNNALNDLLYVKEQLDCRVNFAAIRKDLPSSKGMI
jgi:malate dehydrogenase (quinone)